MKRQESVTEEVTRKMRFITNAPAIERQEVAFILGQILGLLNTVPGMPREKLDELTDSISQFSLRGIEK